uniref:Uncharacterized protein n=1 Tax=Apteryx owenii TaxID=8824 RepID=A0A8B9PEY8_APTOW
IGRQPIMQTIMAGKMEMVLPAMYMMKRFMGICLSGPSATSQQRSLNCPPRASNCPRDPLIAPWSPQLPPWASNCPWDPSIAPWSH